MRARELLYNAKYTSTQNKSSARTSAASAEWRAARNHIGFDNRRVPQ
jgi:hypothetical protein